MSKKRFKRRSQDERNQEIADLLSQRGRSDIFQMQGKHFGWSLKNIPEEYLLWVIENATQREFMDIAEVELWRRKKKVPKD